MRLPLCLALVLVLTTTTLAQPTSVELFDGREAISGKGSELAPAQVALVKQELVKRASHPVLKRRLDQLSPSLEEFEVRDWADGSFTRPGVRQRVYLYRYSYTNGLVVTEGAEVVAHYSGDPGDYALFIASSRVPDLNADGLDEVVLMCNTEDTAEIYAHVFSLEKVKALHLGMSPVFSSNLFPGADLPAKEIEDTAYRGVATGSYLTQQRYVKHADGAWKTQGTSERLDLQDANRLALPRLDSPK